MKEKGVEEDAHDHVQLTLIEGEEAWAGCDLVCGGDSGRSVGVTVVGVWVGVTVVGG